MGLVKTVAIVVLTLSFIVFVALFGRLPAFRRTPIGFLHRCLWVYLPGAFIKLDELLTGKRVTNSVKWIFNYLMNEAHPLVLIFFVILQAGGECMFIPPALKHISPYPHYLTIPIAVGLPYVTLYLSARVSSVITASNHSRCMAAYPFDYVLYHPNIPCQTCRFAKPARSKHCSICKNCVQRSDHHCIWINNCVGRNNYIHFLSLILSTAILLLYASCLGYSILNKITQNRMVPPQLIRGSRTSKHWATRLTWSQYLDAWSITISIAPRIGATTLLSVLCFPLALGFLAYHTYLIWAGMTTNESGKWADLREDIYDDIVFKAKIKEMKRDYPGPLGPEVNPGIRNWKNPCDWWIIRTRGGQHPTRRVADAQGKEIPGAEEVDDRWIRVKELQEVINVYDLGFWDNLKDGLFNRGAHPKREAA